MRDALNNFLIADNELANILTGGLFYNQNIDREKTPEAFDEHKELKPCAVLRMNTRVPLVAHSEVTFADQYFIIYFYQQSGYDQIDIAMERVFDLLHKKTVTTSQGWCYEIVHANDLRDSEDPALKVPMGFSRYKATTLRRL